MPHRFKALTRAKAPEGLRFDYGATITRISAIHRRVFGYLTLLPIAGILWIWLSPAEPGSTEGAPAWIYLSLISALSVVAWFQLAWKWDLELTPQRLGLRVGVMPFARWHYIPLYDIEKVGINRVSTGTEMTETDRQLGAIPDNPGFSDILIRTHDTYHHIGTKLDDSQQAFVTKVITYYIQVQRKKRGKQRKMERLPVSNR